MNKQMTRWFNTWCKCIREGTAQSIYDFYGKPSSRKVSIYERIRARHGNSVRILTASCHVFTVGYLTAVCSMTEGADTSMYNFVVETALNTYTEKVSISTLHAKGLDVLLCQDIPVVIPLHRGVAECLMMQHL